MPTVKDIAKVSGFSTATVSYVVNNGPRAVLPETRDRILRVIAELNYHPNSHARSLRGSPTRTLGVVFPFRDSEPFMNGYFGPVMAGVMDLTTQRKMATILFTGYHWKEAELEAPSLCDGRCDGLLVLAPPREGTLIQDILARRMPVVAVGVRPKDADVDTVDAANVEGAKLGTLHLLELGHRKIGIVLGGEEGTYSVERFEGYKEAMAEFKCEIEPDWIIPNWGPSGETQAKLIRKVLANPENRPTAFFCVQDCRAIKLIGSATQLGIKVPEELSVVGFDDIHEAVLSSPPLTTVRQPMRQIGFRAAELLCKRIEAPSGQKRTLLLDPQFVDRSSTCPPKSRNIREPFYSRQPNPLNRVPLFNGELYES